MKPNNQTGYKYKLGSKVRKKWGHTIYTGEIVRQGVHGEELTYEI